MVNVSENFKTLSMSSGREISCKIIAGSETFYDDRIIEFDFDDVIHPNWYTLGTTCSNRFSFSVRYAGELEVHDEVRPYISFDGEEWCPLGVFFVARRYVRGNYASIICYDRMYSLEMEYYPRVSAPASLREILDDICENYDIECDADVSGIGAAVVPVGNGVRDVLGYIAGAAFGNAKFDREGILRIKKYTGMDEFFFTEKNCMDISRNMSPSSIGRLVVDTGTDMIDVGKGGDLSTLGLYNPLLTKARAEELVGLFEGITFYGADMKMQGLPFLESGDHIYLADESGNYYPLAISEIEFHYDGALTARLYARTCSYTDAAIHRDDLSEALDEIRGSLGNICLKVENTKKIYLSDFETEAADFDFETKVSGTFAQGDLNVMIEGSGAVEIKAYVNNLLIREIIHETEGSKELVHFYFLTEDLRKGRNKVFITIRALSGVMSIKSGGLIATLVCRGSAGGDEQERIRDREMYYEKIDSVGFSDIKFGVKSLNVELTIN